MSEQGNSQRRWMKCWARSLPLLLDPASHPILAELADNCREFTLFQEQPESLGNAPDLGFEHGADTACIDGLPETITISRLCA